ncbi:MAG: hypothetical protein ABIG89_03260 [Candidatus Woesearchaeota archaeon]
MSSIDTLRVLAERDNVTDEFRLSQLRRRRKEAWWSLKYGVVSTGGAGLTSMAGDSSFAKALVGLFSLFALGNFVYAGVKITNSTKAISRQQRFRGEQSLTEPRDLFYLVDGKISAEQTPYEQKYGARVTPYDTLDEALKSEYALGIGLKFIDDVRITAFDHRKQSTPGGEWFADGFPGPEDDKVYHFVNITLSRGEQKHKIKLHSSDTHPEFLLNESYLRLYTAFRDKENLALLMRNSGVFEQMPFRIMSTYDMNQLH